ncbi:MAG: MBL fold metallo-hydrolase [Candidatus Schmidhempelia sp.]|nr:MBL fold metallo-hydrolase [Candidatus Schmidhempelia sp.]
MQYKTIPVTSFAENCTIIWCEKTKKAAIVDPGGECEQIKALVKQLDVAIEKILLTHGHLDHVGAASELAQYYDVAIYGPTAQDQFLLDNLPHQAVQFGFPFASAFQPDYWLKDGETLVLGEQILNVIHCPGHTPGHIVFINKVAKVALVGDVLFKGSIGRTDFPGGNYQDLMYSIKQKLLPLGDDILFISGHGPMSTFGYERKTNPFLI